VQKKQHGNKDMMTDEEKHEMMKARETIALGEIAIVKNTNKYRGSNDEYYLVYLDGLFAKADGEPAPYMFTVADLSQARTRAAKNIEDVRPMKERKWWQLWK